jgi:hypothetical protein
LPTEAAASVILYIRSGARIVMQRTRGTNDIRQTLRTGEWKPGPVMNVVCTTMKWAGTTGLTVVAASLVLSPLLRKPETPPDTRQTLWQSNGYMQSLASAGGWRESSDRQNMEAAQRNHTYETMKREWARFGGVPDVVAWQTPEGRAAVRAANDMARRQTIGIYDKIKYVWIGLMAFTIPYLVYRSNRRNYLLSRQCHSARLDENTARSAEARGNVL